MRKSSKYKLTEGPIIPILFRLAAPMQISILSMTAFNMVDIYFIGRLGTIHQAAITLTFPVIMVVTTFILGLGVGTIATISHAIGEENREKVKRLTTDSLTLTFLIVTGLIITGLATISPLFKMIGANTDTLPMVKDYMQIWYCGMFFVAIPMVGNNAIRATGDTLIPSLIMIAGVFFNIILDPLLIFGIGPFPRLELEGAALATVISRGMTFLLSLGVLHFREKMLTSPFPPRGILIKSWRDILKIGFPVSISNTIMPLSTGILTKIIAPLGPAAIAAFGIAGRIQSFSFTLIYAVSTGLSPFVGQNAGAGKFWRAKKGVTYSSNLSLIWGFFLFLLFVSLGKPIASFFNTDPQVVKIVVLYLSVISLSFGLKGVHQIVWTSLNVLKKPLQSLLLEIFQAFILAVPLALAGKLLFGIQGIFSAIALANFGGGILALITINHFFRKYSPDINKK